MSSLVWGKILETVGAGLLAWVAIRACYIEISITRHLHREPANLNPGLDRLRAGLDAVLERRRRQFGVTEAILVSLGASLIAIGCALYLVGLTTEH